MNNIPLKDKIKLTSGQGNWHLFESQHIEGRRINVADGPHGVRVYGKKVTDGDFLSKTYLQPTTLFPSASAMASTWNKALIESVGQTIGKECAYHEVDVLLGPGINLKRSPLGGRNFEYYSEDPYLTSEMAQGFVRGVQSQNVGACIKHFGLNEQETMRRFVDVSIDARTLHEMYLYPFYKIIQKENPWMIMSSYNKLNGAYASESSELLQDILRKQWGYDGVVVSDWGAVQDKVKSLKNGMNVEMPGPSSFEKDVETALKNNTLSEAELDDSLNPVFALHEKLKDTKKPSSIDLDKHHQVAQAVAREALVLLENDGILPVKNTEQAIGIIGQFAKEPRTNGGGSATVKPYRQEIPYDAFSNVFSNLSYAQGYEENDTSEAQLEAARQVAKDSDIVFFFTGTTESIETEGKDREHMALPAGHLRVFDAIRKVNDNIVVLLSNGSALDLRAIQAGSRAILETWFLGGAAAQAVVDVITGHVSPSGRLQETFPLTLKHTPHYGTFPPLKTANYHHDLIMNGYRYYDTHDYAVLYPFGYGLSYADIEYTAIKWHEDKRQVAVTLHNHSDISAYETVQVYLSAQLKHIVKPHHELKAFKKAWVPAHETITLTIDLPLETFETYDEKLHKFVVYNGTYHAGVGRHSRDIYDIKTFTITGETDYVPPITFDYPVKYLELFFPSWFAFIENEFRSLWWHEKEEPIWRILDRYQRHEDVPQVVMDVITAKLKEDLKN